ncbi:hypothetical protein CTheo_8687 [Ceratobasidium theobromae]|uniref:Uncharacterized protein n=1 Tax=Ceratobasidium theobromae TaxID=1582974 RepID=A0A5N5Q856_9AGAM|nr:hypothetical protein CTheo_8687 [Ceratobasidium theobromae]
MSNPTEILTNVYEHLHATSQQLTILTGAELPMSTMLDAAGQSMFKSLFKLMPEVKGKLRKASTVLATAKYKKWKSMGAQVSNKLAKVQEEVAAIGFGHGEFVDELTVLFHNDPMTVSNYFLLVCDKCLDKRIPKLTAGL